MQIRIAYNHSKPAKRSKWHQVRSDCLEYVVSLLVFIPW